MVFSKVFDRRCTVHNFVALIFLLVTFFVSTVLAQEQNKKHAHAKQMVELMGLQKLVEKGLLVVEETFKLSVENSLKNTSVSPSMQKKIDSYQRQVLVLYSDALSWEAQEPMYIEAYQSLLSEVELEKMVALLKSDVGQKLIDSQKKVAVLTQQNMQNKMTSIKQILQVINVELRKSLSDTQSN
jgi:hypothetical protein